MSASDQADVRHIIIGHRVLVSTILDPPDTFSTARNEAERALIEGREERITDNFSILPANKKYLDVSRHLESEYLPKTLPNIFQLSEFKTVSPRVFSYRRGRFSFEKFPIHVLVPIRGRAVVELKSLTTPVENAVALDSCERGCVIVMHRGFVLHVKEGERVFIVIGCKDRRVN